MIDDTLGVESEQDIDSIAEIMCRELTYSRNIKSFSSCIHKIVKEIGFTDYLFVRLDRCWLSDVQCGLLYSLPEELMRIYHEERLYDIDMMIAYGKHNTQPIFSTQIYGHIDNAPFDVELTKKNRLLIQLNKRFGYLEHCAFPAPASNDNGRVQLIVTSANMEKEPFRSAMASSMILCRSLCKAIDCVSTRKFRSVFIDEKRGPVHLTAKQLGLLQRLVNADTSITRLAHDMCVSPITAHQHIAAVRKALRVKTNIGAVVKAIKTNLIRLD